MTNRFLSEVDLSDVSDAGSKKLLAGSVDPEKASRASHPNSIVANRSTGSQLWRRSKSPRRPSSARLRLKSKTELNDVLIVEDVGRGKSKKAISKSATPDVDTDYDPFESTSGAMKKKKASSIGGLSFYTDTPDINDPKLVDENFERQLALMEADQQTKVSRADALDQANKEVEVSVLINMKPGLVLVDFVRLDDHGRETTVKKLYPRSKQEIRTLKKLVPIKVKLNVIHGDTDEVIEEEEDINEEMPVDEVTSYFHTKKLDEKGQIIFEEGKTVREIFRDPRVGRKRRFIMIKYKDKGGGFFEEVLEIDPTDDLRLIKDAVEEHSLGPALITELHPDHSAVKSLYSTAGDSFRLKSTHSVIEEIKGEEMMEEDSIHSIESSSKSEIEETIEQHEQAKVDSLKKLLVQKLRKVKEDLSNAKQVNRYLGQKLCEYYQLKGPREPGGQDQSLLTEDGIRLIYEKRLFEFNDLVKKLLVEKENRDSLYNEVLKDIERIRLEANKNKLIFFALEKQMISTLDKRACKRLNTKVTLPAMVNIQVKLFESLEKVRLNYVMTKNEAQDLIEKHTKRMEGVEGEEAIDVVEFEKMKIRSQALNDKLDFKEKEILEMKQRLTEGVQGLANVRLKISSLEKNSEEMKKQINEANVEIRNLRENCSKIRAERRVTSRKLKRALSPRGLTRYPYLMPEYESVISTKGEAEKDLLEAMREYHDKKMELQQIQRDHRRRQEKHLENLENVKKQSLPYRILHS